MIKPAKTWEWFRLHSADWDAQSVATLDLATQGFLLLLLRRMLEQMSPVTLDAIRMMSRQYGLQKKSVDRLVDLLQERGIIFATPHGFWCEIADREFAMRDAKAENFSKRNAEISKRRWQKTKENQSVNIPDEERDIERQAPSGPASPNPHQFTLAELDRLPDNEKVPPDAAKAARADIVEWFVAEIIGDDVVIDRARSSIGELFDRGRLTKNSGWKTVAQINRSNDNERSSDERSA